MKHEKFDFGVWLSKYRLIVLLTAVFVVLLTTIAIIYISSYVKYSKVYFENTTEEETGSNVPKYISNSDITKGNETDELTIRFEKIHRKYAVQETDKDDNVIYKEGKITFVISYTTTSGYKIKNVRITTLLTSHWSDNRFVDRSAKSINSSSTTTLDLTYNFPDKVKGPWPVFEKNPHVYLRVEYETSTNNGINFNSKTIYLKADINWSNIIL